MAFTDEQKYEAIYAVFSGYLLGYLSLPTGRTFIQGTGTTSFDVPDDLTNCALAQAALAEWQAIYDHVQSLRRKYLAKAEQLLLEAAVIGMIATVTLATGIAYLVGVISTPWGIGLIATAVAMFITANFLMGRRRAWLDRANYMSRRLNELEEQRSSLETLVDTLCNPAASVLPDVGGVLVDPNSPSVNE
jgi:hypothetical protein